MGEALHGVATHTCVHKGGGGRGNKGGMKGAIEGGGAGVRWQERG